MRTKLNRWERKLRTSYEKGEWKSLGRKTLRRHAALARRQLKQERVNIRLSTETLGKLRSNAQKEGVPYQTLISSVLYRYASGSLHDEKHLFEAMKLLKRAA